MEKTLKLRSKLLGVHIHMTFFFGIEGSRHNLGTIIIDKDDYNWFVGVLRYARPVIECENFKPLELKP